jgi:peptide/nickel transport system ATP-binding protein
MTLLSIKNLRSHFVTHEGLVRAVDGVDIDIGENENLAIVGETGSGKTVLALSILRLLSENTKVEGTVLFRGKDLLHIPEEDLRQIRGKDIAHIFQNPATSLNPVLNIGYQIAEPIMLHDKLKRSIAMKKAIEMLRMVCMFPPEIRAKEYPHTFSGGMQQRAMIAMGLACRPALVIADEPTKGLDVTIQAQIVELMKKLTGHSGTSMLLITHDLSVAAELCDRIAVMYAGELVECADIYKFFDSPAHPYSRGFLSSLPSNGLIPIRGMTASLIHVPPGCRFHPRCTNAADRCRFEHPEFYEVGEGQYARCFLYA